MYAKRIPNAQDSQRIASALLTMVITMRQKQFKQIGALFMVLGNIYLVAAACYYLGDKYVFTLINVCAGVCSIMIGHKIRQMGKA